MSPSRKRTAVTHLQETFSVSQRMACDVLDQPRSTQRYAAVPAEDESVLVARMHELVRAHPRFGYRRIARMLRREGFRVNVKRVYRLWRQEGFKVPRKTRGSFKTSKKVNSLASELHTSAFERRHFYANHPVAAVRLWAKSHRVQDGPAAVSQ